MKITKRQLVKLIQEQYNPKDENMYKVFNIADKNLKKASSIITIESSRIKQYLKMRKEGDDGFKSIMMNQAMELDNIINKIVEIRDRFSKENVLK